jgi:hypothetical protein
MSCAEPYFGNHNYAQKGHLNAALHDLSLHHSTNLMLLGQWCAQVIQIASCRGKVQLRIGVMRALIITQNQNAHRPQE